MAPSAATAVSRWGTRWRTAVSGQDGGDSSRSSSTSDTCSANAGTLLRHGMLRTARRPRDAGPSPRTMLLRSGVLALAAIVAICVSVAVSSANTNDSYSSGGSVAPITQNDFGNSSGVDTEPSALPNPGWQEGGCVSLSGSMAYPVPCTDSHEGTVLMRTIYEADCPPQTDGTVVNGGFIYCIDRD